MLSVLKTLPTKFMKHKKWKILLLCCFFLVPHNTQYCKIHQYFFKTFTCSTTYTYKNIYLITSNIRYEIFCEIFYIYLFCLLPSYCNYVKIENSVTTDKKYRYRMYLYLKSGIGPTLKKCIPLRTTAATHTFHVIY